jgi:hypothetical protein
MYKLKSTRNKQKNFIFLASLWSLTKRAGSKSVSQRYGSSDPDQYQNVTDPEHGIIGFFFFSAQYCVQFVPYILRNSIKITRERKNTSGTFPEKNRNNSAHVVLGYDDTALFQHDICSWALR